MGGLLCHVCNAVKAPTTKHVLIHRHRNTLKTKNTHNLAHMHAHTRTYTRFLSLHGD
jgi:hypothetical protein